MIKQLAHVCIHTQDLDATEAFYRDVLGMEKSFNFEREGAHFGYYLKAGNNSFIEVFKGNPGAAGNINHLALEVDDLDAALARIRACGIKANDKVYGKDEAWQSWLTDPNGVRIELHQYTPKSMQQNGGLCVVDW